jgi:hypothetical protein
MVCCATRSHKKSAFTQKLAPRTFCSAHELGMILLQDRIQDVMRRGCRAPDFLTSVETHTRTLVDTQRSAARPGWKHFSTVMNAPQTIFILDYALPCDAAVPHFEIEVQWRVLHVGQHMDTPFRAEGLTDVPVTNLFVSRTL